MHDRFDEDVAAYRNAVTASLIAAGDPEISAKETIVLINRACVAGHAVAHAVMVRNCAMLVVNGDTKAARDYLDSFTADVMRNAELIENARVAVEAGDDSKPLIARITEALASLRKRS